MTCTLLEDIISDHPEYKDDKSIRIGLQALKELEIDRDVDIAFLEANARSLPPHSDLPSHILEKIQSIALNHLSSPSHSALALYNEHLIGSTKSRARLSSTVPDLDQLLKGGFDTHKGEIVEVVGSKHSARHLLVLNSILNDLVLNPSNRVLYVHTGTFDVQRCLSILVAIITKHQGNGVSFNRRTNETEDDTSSVQELDVQKFAIHVLNRLSVTPPTLSSRQALDHIQVELRRQDLQSHLELSSIVIDPIDGLLGGSNLTSSDNFAKGYSDMVSFMRTLSRLARSPEHPFVALLINSSSISSSASMNPMLNPISQFSSSTTSNLSTGSNISAAKSSVPNPSSIRPSLGTTFTYLTDVSLWLTKAESIWPELSPIAPLGTADRKPGLKFVIELVKNHRGPARGWTMFESIDGVSLEPVHEL